MMLRSTRMAGAWTRLTMHPPICQLWLCAWKPSRGELCGTTSKTPSNQPSKRRTAVVQVRRSSRRFPPSCRPTLFVVWISHLDVTPYNTFGGTISIRADVHMASQSDARSPSKALRSGSRITATGHRRVFRSPARIRAEELSRGPPAYFGTGRRPAGRTTLSRLPHDPYGRRHGSGNGGVYVDHVSGNGEITG